jgi:phosphonopyruvate decarboxylase
VIFDNNTYESTGGQATTADTTSFAGVGRAVGYRNVAECRDIDEVGDALERAATSSGPHLVVIRTAAMTALAPPRATSAISAPEIHARFAAVAGT